MFVEKGMKEKRQTGRKEGEKKEKEGGREGGRKEDQPFHLSLLSCPTPLIKAITVFSFSSRSIKYDEPL